MCGAASVVRAERRGARRQSDFEIGVLFGIFAFFQIVGSLLFGFVIDRYETNTKHTLFGGLLALAATTALFALADAYWVLCVARACQGVAAAASWSAAMALIPRNLDERERGRATAVVMSCSGIGTIAGPILSGALTAAGGRRLPFYLLAGVIVLDAGARLLLVERPFAPTDRGGASAAKLSMLAGYRILLADVEIATLLFLVRAARRAPNSSRNRRCLAELFQRLCLHGH